MLVLIFIYVLSPLRIFEVSIKASVYNWQPTKRKLRKYGTKELKQIESNKLDWLLCSTFLLYLSTQTTLYYKPHSLKQHFFFYADVLSNIHTLINSSEGT